MTTPRFAGLQERLATMQSLIAARKLESYLEHHRKFHFGIYAMSGIPLLVETIENMWLRCGPVLSFVIPEYVVLLKGWDHHTAALKAIMAGDADGAEREIVADITEAAQLSCGSCRFDGTIAPPVRLVSSIARISDNQNFITLRTPKTDASLSRMPGFGPAGSVAPPPGRKIY